MKVEKKQDKRNLSAEVESKRHIEIMDTTLRDGEQTSGVSFSSSEKLTIAQLLLTEVKADRIEIASARVSEGEFQAVKRITNWASENGHIDKVEVLTFVDGDTSIKWMQQAGAKVMNLLTKGSLNHLTHQLKKTPDQHFKEIAAVVKLAGKKGITCNVYLEDWSNGMRHSKDYVFQYLDFISKQPVKRVMLPDTLGVLIPSETYTYLSEIVTRYPNLHFDFHGHNDYDLSVANALEAVRAGVQGLHLTINGMGERAGNTPLESTVAVLNDFEKDVKISINEKALFKVSKLVEAFSGFRISANKPVVGENVFTQTAGIHADGDKKKNLYYNDLMPERFGRKRKYALGKTSGKANIENNLQQLGIQLGDEDLKKVTQRIIELGDRKETVTQDDLPYIISDILDSNTIIDKVSVENYVLTHSKNMRPSATIRIKFEDSIMEENALGDGQYDAFMNALKKIYTQKKLLLPKLTDYEVRIPPGGKTDALCETVITWEHNGRELKTTGLDSDQTVAAIKATQKILNLI
ncbi:MAG TPA: alpha-isopropylmalate synthase regulatory domain-containing protein [Niabella sp.]|nr:alpha-isopropylmalate synthase regulatory domain-containing protein [Niabella sp.]HOZ97502.1 alpha-isopropylmalate synthase regulatory domain-containing protein [Niabella sp.]HQW15590.1 alpha-isopropylmalate synthase regulatory domain-containing protein [Niabella sp.]HQX20733.1 alpha-isopropylmalate synthase regulatory domain-containing protein [Niabella sp.]HQX40913.1 alpha-isopropylmalate synthase regulatory domain-containing protein [Niabella sp.]